MAPDIRIVLTVERKMGQFLQRLVEETGIDRSNLIRGWIWEKMQAERDRQIAEHQMAAEKKKRPQN